MPAVKIPDRIGGAVYYSLIIGVSKDICKRGGVPYAPSVVIGLNRAPITGASPPGGNKNIVKNPVRAGVGGFH